MKCVFTWHRCIAVRCAAFAYFVRAFTSFASFALLLFRCFAAFASFAAVASFAAFASFALFASFAAVAAFAAFASFAAFAAFASFASFASLHLVSCVDIRTHTRTWILHTAQRTPHTAFSQVLGCAVLRCVWMCTDMRGRVTMHVPQVDDRRGCMMWIVCPMSVLRGSCGDREAFFPVFVGFVAHVNESNQQRRELLHTRTS